MAAAGSQVGRANRSDPPSVYIHRKYIQGGYSSRMTRFEQFDRAEVEALLPLPAAAFPILLAVADQDRHG